MARQSQRISFETFADMAAHLDRWAATSMTTPAAWEDALVGAQSWLDYSARNQVLLASYGADGPVAGVETWRLVPSTHEDRGCAVRSGEHGYPVRVPITTGGTEPDPYVGGSRPTRSAVERWEWRPVFAIDQLARRPAPDALMPADLPAALRGPQADTEFLAAVRRVATATVRGRLPKSEDPHRVLADAAGRLRRSAKRPDLDPVLREQAAWLVADRVGLAPTDRPPEYDPSGSKPRERWERLQDVLEPARKLTAGLGVIVGVDLVASPLPRMEVVDDRVVPAGRRHRLPAASLEQLPIGRWVTVGPYTPAEWAARGEHASGQGTYLRLNKTAYLVAVERGDLAGWRLEDVAARTGNGLLATGSAPSLDQAQADAVATVRSRYPALTGPVDVTGPSPGGAAGRWEAMPGDGRSSAELRHLSDQVTLYVIPGPGGRWMPAFHHGPTGDMERLPSARTLDEARDAAELAGQRVVRTLAVADPARLDTTVAAFAASDDYTRHELAALVGQRLDEPDRQRVDTATPAELVELLGAAPDFELKDRTPFFVWYSSSTPHAPHVSGGLPIAEERYKDTFRRSVPRRGWEERLNEDTADKAANMHDREPVGRKKMLTIYRARLRSLVSLDDTVRSIVNDLDRHGELDDTVIIFTSDNGMALGEHRYRGKVLPYEAMLEVPMIVRSPTIRHRYDPTAAPGTTVQSGLTVTTLDIPAAIVKLADRWTYFGWDAAPRPPRARRQIEFNAKGRFTAREGWVELYDRRHDPFQLDNSVRRLPEVASAMRSMTEAKFKCQGAECVWDANGWLE